MIATQCAVVGATIPLQFLCGSQSDAGRRFVTVSEFARSATVEGIQSQVGLLQTQFSDLSGQLGGFASSADLQGLRTQIGNLGTALNSLSARVTNIENSPAIREYLRKQSKQYSQQSAMMEALQPVRPSEGSSNRLGFTSAMDGDQGAVGFNYSHVSSNMDVSLGLAVSGDQTMAKAGAGFSW